MHSNKWNVSPRQNRWALPFYRRLTVPFPPRFGHSSSIATGDLKICFHESRWLYPTRDTLFLHLVAFLERTLDQRGPPVIFTSLILLWLPCYFNRLHASLLKVSLPMIKDRNSDKGCNGHEYHQRSIGRLTNPSIVHDVVILKVVIATKHFKKRVGSRVGGRPASPCG